MFAFDQEITVGDDTFDSVKDTQKLDLLERKAFGLRLSELMERDTQPLVVALDGPWGAGKSHFLKLWVGSHNKPDKNKAKIVYFDAFAQDYLDDPLISLVAAISVTKEVNQGQAAKAVDTLKRWHRG